MKNISITFSAILGIISVLLGMVSIILSIIIYRLSNITSKQLAEEAAQRAFEKQSGINRPTITNDLTPKNHRNLKKKLTYIITQAQKNSKEKPWVYAAYFPVQLKKFLNEETTIEFMYDWKRREILTWTGDLENSTRVYITKGDELIADINSC